MRPRPGKRRGRRKPKSLRLKHVMQPTTDPFESTIAEDSDNFQARAEQYAREEPMKAVGVAFLGGLILTFLPIATVIGAFLRLALMLLKPALLVLGAIKLYEEVERRQQEG
jgi:uncharacterized membrane protein